MIACLIKSNYFSQVFKILECRQASTNYENLLFMFMKDYDLSRIDYSWLYLINQGEHNSNHYKSFTPKLNFN